MAETPIGEHRLASLRHRWEQDPTSRIFVQLAEAHRRRGEVTAALEVLERGLEHHPRYLSANIVQARCYLEQSQAEKARKVLEAVVVRDPTHLVAGQLLVETHLQLGERPAALDALERYRLLGAGGEDFDELERRANGLGPTASEVSSERPEPATEVATELSTDLPTELPTVAQGVVTVPEGLSSVGDEGLSPTSDGEEVTARTHRVDVAGGQGGSDAPFDLSAHRAAPLNLPASPEVRTRGALYRAGSREPFGAVEVMTPPLPMPGAVFTLGRQPDEDVDSSDFASAIETQVVPPVGSATTRSRTVADRTWKGSSTDFAPKPSTTTPLTLGSRDLPEDSIPASGDSGSPVEADPRTLDMGDEIDVLAQESASMPQEEEAGAPVSTVENAFAVSTEAEGVTELQEEPSTSSPPDVSSEVPDGSEASFDEVPPSVEAASDSAADTATYAGFEVELEAPAEAEVEIETEAPVEVPEAHESAAAPQPVGDLDGAELPPLADAAEDIAEEVGLEETSLGEAIPEEAIPEEAIPEEAGSEEISPEEEFAEHDINEAVASIVELDAPLLPLPPTLAASATPAEESVSEVEELAPEEPPSTERVTATLGDLYRRQGHLEEAARVYRQVLEHEPTNGEALAGLAALSPEPVEASTPTPAFQREVTAQDLLGDGAVHERGLTARKLVLLQQYLTRIQGKGGQDVPREAE